MLALRCWSALLLPFTHTREVKKKKNEVLHEDVIARVRDIRRIVMSEILRTVSKGTKMCKSPYISKVSVCRGALWYLNYLRNPLSVG